MATMAVQSTTDLLIAGHPGLDGVRVLDVDDHRWAHPRHTAGTGPSP